MTLEILVLSTSNRPKDTPTETTPKPEDHQYNNISSPAPKSVKTKSRVRSSSKVNKRKSKSSGSLPTPTSLDRGLTETPSALPSQNYSYNHDPSCPNAGPISYTVQQQQSAYTFDPLSYAIPNIAPYLSSQPMMGDGQHYGANQAAYIHAANCSSRLGTGSVAMTQGYRVQGQQSAYASTGHDSWGGQSEHNDGTQ